MEKLIELLNEYDSNWGVTGYWALFNSMNEWISEKEDLQVISKKFWFIKWLIENDKIELKAWHLYWFQPIMSNRQPFTLYETLLMLLSIQDNPIEFLCSILK